MEKSKNDNHRHPGILKFPYTIKTSKRHFSGETRTHHSILTTNYSILNTQYLILTAFFLFCLTGQLFSQQNNLPLNRQSLLNIEKHLNHPDNYSHTNVKPYIESVINYDAIARLEFELQKRKERTSWLGRKLKQESLIFVDTSDFSLSIDPVFDFNFSRDVADNSSGAEAPHFYTNTRGLAVRGNIGKKVSFESSFYESQSFFVGYINDFVKKYSVVPGQGRVKPFKGNGFDYGIASGIVSYSPSPYFNFQFGHGKNFIGEGYRSLLLSDNAFNYPFFKINTRFAKNKLQYTNLYASLQNLDRISFSNSTEALFVRKSASFHYLSWNVYRRLQIGFFEGIIWKTSENTYPKPVNPAYYAPLIFVNSLLLLNDTNNKTLIGTNIKYKILKNSVVYGQLILDEVEENRHGFQIGLKTFDIFRIKNLHFQAEYNTVSAFTYAHQTPLQSYSHYNQALAHPIGANFKEMVGIGNYRLKDLFIQLKINYITYKEDVAGSNFGRDILKSDRDIAANIIAGNPLPVKLIYHDIAIGYTINPKTNMNIILGFTNRYYNNTVSKLNNQMLYFAFRTSLFNSYYDF